MKNLVFVFLVCSLLSCVEKKNNELSAQQIIDKAIEVSGGEYYDSSVVSFAFRGKNYLAQTVKGKKELHRITSTDSLTIRDVRTEQSFQRFFNDSLIVISDSIALRYANSVNSVHYFARLPFGLNDPAVNKEYLGQVFIKNMAYYKVKVTFDQNGGGEDFDDIYIYWFNNETFKPDFLAYKFHIDGGGIRFREAYNERYVNGIRFVDYKNFKANSKKVDIYDIETLFAQDSLELLSKIELENIDVQRIN